MNEENSLEQLAQQREQSLYSHPEAKRFLSKVYAWMALTLFIAAGTAVYCVNDTALLEWCIDHTILLCLGGLVVVCVMSLGCRVFSAGALAILLVLFSVMEGLWFGPLLSFYTQESLGTAFACTAGTFGVMALYGAVTKRNLTLMGRTLMMLLIGLIICLLFNCFLVQSSTFDLVLSLGGVVLFSLLTAHDTQQLLIMGAQEGDETVRAKGAVMGALTLYLDFINIFLFLLRFLGDRR